MVLRQGKRGGDEDRNVSSTDTGAKGCTRKSSETKSKKRIESRFYKKVEWSKLTAEEKAQVIAFKKQKKENKNKNKGSSNKRKASSTKIVKHDEATSGGEENGDKSTTQSGNEFGRGAHKIESHHFSDSRVH